MNRTFFKHLKRSLKGHFNCDSKVFKEIELEFKNVFNSSKADITSKQDRSHLKLASLVLASHSVLSSRNVDKTIAVTAIRDAIVLPNRNWIRIGIKSMLFLAKDPMTSLTDYCSTRIPQLYGNSFEF